MFDVDIYGKPVISLFWTFKNKLQLLFQATLYLNIVQCKRKSRALKLKQKKTNFIASFFIHISPYDSAPETANYVSWFFAPQVLVFQNHIKISLTSRGKNIYSTPGNLDACISFSVLGNSTRHLFLFPFIWWKPKIHWDQRACWSLIARKWGGPDFDSVLPSFIYHAISAIPLLCHLLHFQKSFPIEHHEAISPSGFFTLHVDNASSTSTQFAP